MESVYSYLDFWCTFLNTYLDALIEISTHPACFHFINLVVFVTIIMGVNESSTRREGRPMRGGQESAGYFFLIWDSQSCC